MNPLCDDCGMACYVCPKCDVAFICSCDNPPHNCQKKKIGGVAGNPLGLYLKLLNIDSVEKVSAADAKLDIKEDGKPVLKGWHIRKDGEERDENIFEYEDGYWMQIFPELNIDNEYHEMSEFDPNYLDDYPEYGY